MRIGAGPWRVAAAAAIVVCLLAFAVLLIPVYYRNLQFARSLESIARESQTLGQSDDALRAAVVDRAARIGLPVQAGQVRLRRSPDRLRIEVRYMVPVELSVYSVRLHFHPSAER